MPKPSSSFLVPRSSQSKVAIIHDWLTDLGGAERVAIALQNTFPGAPIYTSVYEPDERLRAALGDREIRTTWLQKLPKPLRRFHKLFPVLRVWAFRSLDLSEFDVIISSSSAEAKAVRKSRPDQVHICYCHTPIRYYWNGYEDYRRNPGFGWLDPVIRLLMPVVIPAMRRLDYASAQRVDQFIANSTEVRARIAQYYGREATVVFPPVDLDRFARVPEPAQRHGFLAGGRHVAYKRLDLAIAACNRLELPLTVYGRGPSYEHHLMIAGPTIRFVSSPSDEEVAQLFKSAEAFIFPAFEDFGIVQVEALAAGTPLICYADGGSRDIVEETNGITFAEQTADSVVDALSRFQSRSFDHQTIAASAQRFSTDRFTTEIQTIVAHAKGE